MMDLARSLGISCCLIILFLLSCCRNSIVARDNNSSIDSLANFKEVMEEIDSTFIIDDRVYIAIPQYACTACIEPAFKFMLANYRSEKYLFIITEINDLSALKGKFGSEILNHNNVRLDTLNEITRRFYSIYPQIFEIRKGKLIKYKQIDQSNIIFWTTLNQM